MAFSVLGSRFNLINMTDEKIRELMDAYMLIIEDGSPVKPEYVGLNMFKLIGEWVESPDLLGFPKELQIELCKSIRRRHDGFFIISFN